MITSTTITNIHFPPVSHKIPQAHRMILYSGEDSPGNSPRSATGFGYSYSAYQKSMPHPSLGSLPRLRKPTFHPLFRIKSVELCIQKVPFRNATTTFRLFEFRIRDTANAPSALRISGCGNQVKGDKNSIAEDLYQSLSY